MSIDNLFNMDITSAGPNAWDVTIHGQAGINGNAANYDNLSVPPPEQPFPAPVYSFVPGQRMGATDVTLRLYGDIRSVIGQARNFMLHQMGVI